MIIERSNEEVIIKLPKYVNVDGLEQLVDYLTYKKDSAKSKAKQADVDKLVEEIKEGWWAKNRNRFIK